MQMIAGPMFGEFSLSQKKGSTNIWFVLNDKKYFETVFFQ